MLTVGVTSPGILFKNKNKPSSLSSLSYQTNPITAHRKFLCARLQWAWVFKSRCFSIIIMHSFLILANSHNSWRLECVTWCKDSTLKKMQVWILSKILLDIGSNRVHVMLKVIIEKHIYLSVSFSLDLVLLDNENIKKHAVFWQKIL